MSKALFFRKCTSEADLHRHYNILSAFGQELEYKIVKTIILSKDEYRYFSGNFLLKNDYIDKLKDQLYMDKNDCLHCLLIKAKNNNGILVYPSGYSYARYTAFYNND